MITALPWFAEIIATAAFVAAFVVLVRFGRSVASGIWAAIVAAPLIASGLEELVQLVKGDIIGRLDAGVERLDGIDQRLHKIDVLLVDNEARIKRIESRGGTQ